MQRSGCFLTLAIFFLPMEAVLAVHPVRIAVKDSTESRLLAEIAAHLVRHGFDEPVIMSNFPDAKDAWNALQQGQFDVYPESIALLAREIAHDPNLVTVEQLRQALAGQPVRLSNPIGAGLVLVYRADLPDRLPHSALALLKTQGLVSQQELDTMASRCRKERLSESTVAADFLRGKLPASPGRQTGTAGPTRAAIVLAAFGIILGLWGRSRFKARRRAAMPDQAGPPCVSLSPGPARR